MDKSQDNDNLKNKFRKNTSSYAKFSSLAIQMGLIIGGGTYLGSYVDANSAREFPLWTLILSLSSVAIALYYVLKSVIKK